MINSAVAALRTLSYLDSVADARHQNSSIDNAINTAILALTKPTMGNGAGDGKFPTLSVRSEVSPLLMVSSTVVEAYLPVVLDGTTLSVNKGYTYKIESDIENDDDYVKLIALGFKTKLGLDGSIITISNVRQISGEPVIIKTTTKVQLSKAYTVKVSKNPTFELNGKLITRSSIEDRYGYYVGIRLTVAGSSNPVYCIPSNIDSIGVLLANPHTRPSLVGNSKLAYSIESEQGWTIESGVDGIISKVEFFYVSIPDKIFCGKEYDLQGDGVLAQLLNKKVIVRTEYAMISGEIYECGTEFTVSANMDLEEGIVSYGYRNSNLPDVLLDEVCREAAKQLSISTSNKEKQDAIANS